MHTDTEQAYFAGIIDGEGTITITLSERQGSKGYRQHQVLMDVATNHQQTMEALALIWGARITERKQPKGRRSTYALRWQNKTAAAVIRELRPYLRIKVAQADIVLKMADEIAARDYPAKALSKEEWDQREQYRLAVRRLNYSRYGMQAQEYREPGTLRCSICGNEFSEYKTRKKMFCGDECKRKAYRRYNATYRARRKQT